MKRAKKLLILLGVLIVMCAAAFAASKLNPELNTGNDDTDGSAVFTLDADSVTSLSFRYTGSFSFDAAKDAAHTTISTPRSISSFFVLFICASF